MIEPFQESLAQRGAISYGISSYGYDFRVDRTYKVCSESSSTLLDPKEVSAEFFNDFEGDHCIVPPGSFVLAQSVEYFRIPRDILTLCTGKSSYARCGILVNATPGRHLLRFIPERELRSLSFLRQVKFVRPPMEIEKENTRRKRGLNSLRKANRKPLTAVSGNSKFKNPNPKQIPNSKFQA